MNYLKVSAYAPILCEFLASREETVLSRLHIGYTFLTHLYLLKGEEPPVCIPCDEVMSVEHILASCVDLQEYRHICNSCSLRLLFRECSPDNIVELGFSNLQISLAKCGSTIVPSKLVIFIQDCDCTRL